MEDSTFEMQPNFHSLIDLLQHRLSTSPQHTPYIFLTDEDSDDAPVTYTELLHTIHGIAANLQTQTIAGDRVLLLTPPGLQYITAFFGTIFAGCLPVPLYPPRNNRSIERVQTVAKDAQAKIALATPKIIAKIERLTAKSETLAQINLLNLDENIIDQKAAQWGNPQCSADDIAFLQYTSGSTAEPKGVMVSHKNLLSNLRAIQQHFHPQNDDVSIFWLPPYHDMGLIGGILSPIYCDSTCVLMSPVDFVTKPIRWLKAISDYHAKINSAPNFAYDLCVESTTPETRADLDLSHWEYAIVGAEPVRAETLKRFTKTFAPYGFNAGTFTPSYGLAEATLLVSSHHQTEAPTLQHFSAEAMERGIIDPVPDENGRTHTLVSCGTIIADHKVTIINPETKIECPPDEIGEIWINGASVAKGYWQKPEATQSTFNAQCMHNGTDKFLRTGDLGFFYNDELFIAGRIKDLIIIQGRNHYPQDIELTVEKSHPALVENGCAAFSIDVDDQEQLVVVQEIQRTAIRHTNSNDVIKTIRKSIVEAHQIYPYAIVLVKPMAIPRTSSGKIQHFECRKMYQDGYLKSIAAWTYTPNRNITSHQTIVPRTPIESTLADIWTDVLEIDSIGVHDDFFQWGGDSLSATQVASRIHHAFDINFPLETLFNTSTIAQLATMIEKLLRDEETEQAISIEPTLRGKPLPTAFSQERMWFIQQLQPQNSAYNIVVSITITGNLNIDVLNWAFNRLIERHESLRTIIPIIDGNPYQQILPELKITPTIVDLRYLDPQERNIKTEKLAQAEAKCPFDLSQPPLIRVMVIQLEDARFFAQATIHHAIFDAWSSGVFGRDLLELYQSRAENREPRLPNITIQYADFAFWQRQWFKSGILDKQLDYWVEQVKGLSALSLPTDFPRPSVQTLSGSFIDIEDLTALFQDVKTFSIKYHATSFMVFLAAFELLLYRYTQQTDFAIGVPIANRHHLDSENIIGTLVNTLAIRATLNPDANFLDLLHQVKGKTLAAYAHQDLPFEQLVSVINPVRDPSHAPLFQVMLDYINVFTPNRQFGELTWEMVHIDRGGSQFDMTLIVVDTKEAQTVGIEYNTDLFTADTINRFLEHFRTLLTDIIHHPTLSLSKLTILPDAERMQILRQWNDTRLQYPTHATILDLIENQAKKTPNAIALVSEKTSLSYQELITRADKVAHYLRMTGVKTGDYVGVMLHRNTDMPVALLGILKAGGAYIPLDPTFPLKRLTFMLADTNAKFILTHSDLSPSFKDAIPKTTFIEIDRDWQKITATNAAKYPLPQLTPDNLAYIIYTSGSTGNPKGVQISHQNATHFLHAMLKEPGLKSSDTMLAVTTLSFDPSVLELFLPLTVGAKIVQVSSDIAHNGYKLIEALALSGATVMQATPTTWQMLIDAGWQGDPYLKVLCGGEALLPTMATALLARVGELWNVYGPTETTVWATVARITSADGISIGTPIANTQCYILDTEGEPTPIGVTGELFIGGDGVAIGYLNKPDLNETRFIPNPFSDSPNARMYRTGDLARYRTDGTIEFLGRIDHQVKVRGFRIELGEIESKLNQHPNVLQAVVTPYNQQQLAAYIIPAKDTPSVTQLRQSLLEDLPNYMVPAYFTFLTEFPLTPNKKVDRKALPAPDLVRPKLSQNFVAPQNDTEIQLREIWEDLLKISPIGVKDNFFDLGGHSLIALHLFEQIESTFGISIPLTALFQDPTIETLAQHIRAQQSSTWSSLIEIEGEENKPSFFCIHGITGDILWFRELAHKLSPHYSFFGLQAQGLNGNQPVFIDIPQIASAYLKEIRQKQPTGPYFLGGASFGGTVALEMAQQLLAQGETVGLLAIFDHAPSNIQYDDKVSLSQYLTQLKNLLQNLPNWLNDIRQIGMGKSIARLRRKTRVAFQHTSAKKYHPSAADLIDYAAELPAHRQSLIEQHFQALSQYSPKPLNAKILLLRAKSRPLFNLFDPEFAWRQLSTQDLIIRDIPGSHERMFVSPNVEILARHLKEGLDNAER